MWGAIIAGVVAIVTALISGEQNKNQAERQASANMDLAKFQAQANENYLEKQLQYNTPANQMSRFQQAGLNPNLIYGQGSPGNQQAPLSFPDIKPADYQKNTIDNIAPLFNQTRLVNSQVQAQDANTRQKHAQVELMKLQGRVIAANPLLDDEGFKATIDGLKAAAELKQNEANISGIKWYQEHATANTKVEMIWKQMELLEQRFQLNNADKAVKAQILKSKEFQNAILEVQKKFMTDGEITPQHILQFVQLLLLKAL